MTPELMQITLHELRVHQIELEMQNEELRRTQLELESARSRYFDLYDLAPIGYVTINEPGFILEANLTACHLLGVARGALTNWPIRHLLDKADHDLFDHFCSSLIHSGESNTGESQSCELRMIRHDGTQIWVSLLAKVDSNSRNTVVLQIAISDVTELKQAELGRHESEQRFAAVMNATQDGIWDWNIESDHVYFSPQWARLLEYEPAEIRQHVETFFDLLHPHDHDQVAKQIRDHFADSSTEKCSEIRLRVKSGEYRWFLDRGKVVARDSAGNPTRMVGTITDIETRKQTEHFRMEVEARLREREGRLRKAQAISKIGNFHWNAATDDVYWSDQLFRIYGRDPGKFTPSFSNYIEAIHPEDREMVSQTLQQAIESLGEFDHEYRVIRPDGGMIWVHALGGAIASEARVLVGLEGTCQDISERKKADGARKEAQERLQKIASRVPGVVCQFRIRPDGSTCFPYASSATRDIFHIESDELINDGAKMFATIHPDDASWVSKSIYESARLLTPWKRQFRIRMDDGTEKWLWSSSIPEREPDGGTLFHGVIMDITERNKVEERLRWSQSLLQMMSNSSPLGFLVVDNRTDAILYSNARFCEIWGIEHIADRIRNGELNNKDIIPHCLKVLADIPAFAASCAPLQDESNRITIEDEIAFTENRTVRRFSTQIRDDADRYYGRFYIFEEITARKQADAERESLQAQLRESQKMEAVGTLAGGIAHDFNNILAVILGNAELATTIDNQNPSLGVFLGEIRKAGIRARDLVQQILSFSRQRPTELVPVSLAAVVQESASLLRATLPARLTLSVDCKANLPQVLGDTTQLVQVILNLVTNSMQAIGNEMGEISIRLDSVVLDSQLTDSNPVLGKIQPRLNGRLLRLSISDNGPGMSSTITERVFEPFFTTKPVGKGTGLGLSVVHGIVTAHNGTIVVESKEGQGARFTIYLLPAPTKFSADTNQQTTPDHTLVTSTEPSAARVFHILLLDDSDAVLMVAQGLLEIRGYRVTAFTNQREALVAIQNDPLAFDLVVTDYNMPGMSGLDISRAVGRIRQNLPVAVTSGFIDEELRGNAERAGVKDLISKPFKSSDLFRKVEQLLAASS